jgi:anti-sigma factor RsiW
MSTIGPPEELISAYLDGEATPDERALVERQLDGSSEWRSVLDEVRSTRALLLGLPTREAPTGFWDSLLHPDIAPVLELDVRRAKSRPAKRAITWLAGAAAAAAIVAVVAIPQQSRVKPAVATLVSRHAVRSSVSAEPVSELAPVAQPVKLGP